MYEAQSNGSTDVFAPNENDRASTMFRCVLWCVAEKFLVAKLGIPGWAEKFLVAGLGIELNRSAEKCLVTSCGLAL